MSDSAARTAAVDMADYFSRLPEWLIHHILSSLPSNEIYRTCVLSKYFNSVWNKYPHREFYLEDSRFKKNPERAENSFEQCLFGRPFIQQLRIELLGCYDMNNLTPKLDRWLCLSLGKNVSRLVLKVHYSVPHQVFASPTLEVLDLTCCSLEEDRIVHIELPCLEKLSLSNCGFVGDNLLQKILCASPKIKHISLVNCTGLRDSLYVSGTPLLKHFLLRCKDEFGRIKIDAPSLHTFTYKSKFAWCAIDLTSCTNLKELYLYFVVDWVLEKLQSILFRIQVLELNFCRLEKKHKISSQSLKRLILHGSDRVNDIEIDAPNLQSFECSLLRFMSSMLKFNSWSIPKANDIHMKFLAGGFQEACRAGIQDFLMKLSNYEDLKLLIFNKPTLDNYLIMIMELHEVPFSSLQTLANNSSFDDIFISSRDVTNLVHHQFSGKSMRSDSTISIICSSWQSVKSFRKKFENWSCVKVKYGRMAS